MRSEQRIHLALADLRGRRKPAIRAHSSEALRQDMLKEAPQELVCSQETSALLASGGVAVRERHTVIILPQQARGGDGGLKDIAGEILQRLLSAARGLAVHHPCGSPYPRRDRRQELRVFRSQRFRLAESSLCGSTRACVRTSRDFRSKEGRSTFFFSTDGRGLATGTQPSCLGAAASLPSTSNCGLL